MNPLRTLENVIAGLVEGTFGRVFRSEVRPMELAHKLAREMDDHTTASVSRTYAPNEYSVWLSPRDRERYEGVEEEIIEELCAYLLEHARREDFALATAPHIAFHTDEKLRLGEFGIQARMGRHPDAPARPVGRGVDPARDVAGGGRSARLMGWGVDPARPAAGGGGAAPPVGRGVDQGGRSVAPPPPPPEEGGHTMIYSNASRVRDALAQAGGPRRERALLVVDGRRVIVPPRGALLGRSRDCDVVLDDPSVSRRHAELRPEGEGWVVCDLHSTNGILVNGRPVRDAHPLRSGDRIELGSAQVLFEIAP